MTTFVIHGWQTSIAFSLPYQLCFAFAFTSSSPFSLIFSLLTFSAWSLLLHTISFPSLEGIPLSPFFYARMVSIGGNFFPISVCHLEIMTVWQAVYQKTTSLKSPPPLTVLPSISVWPYPSPFKLMIRLVLYQGSTTNIEFVIWRIIYK
jgi:hypothetical protein